MKSRETNNNKEGGMGSGNAGGNLIAVIIVIVSALFGFVSFDLSATILLIAAYLIGGYWLYMDYFGYSEYKPDLMGMLTPYEKEVSKKYHLYLSAYMGPAQGVSALINTLRLAGIIWGIIALFKGVYLIPVLFALYFISVSWLVPKLDPDLYLGGYAQKTGDPSASNEYQTLRSVVAKIHSLINHV